MTDQEKKTYLNKLYQEMVKYEINFNIPQKVDNKWKKGIMNDISTFFMTSCDTYIKSGYQMGEFVGRTTPTIPAEQVQKTLEHWDIVRKEYVEGKHTLWDLYTTYDNGIGIISSPEYLLLLRDMVEANYDNENTDV